jgi:hypothetical protein
VVTKQNNTHKKEIRDKTSRNALDVIKRRERERETGERERERERERKREEREYVKKE